MTSIHYVLVALIFWSVFCRARHMNPSTPARYKVQHGAVLLLAVISTPLFGFERFAPQLLGGAICIYLWIDAIDWRGSQPTVPPHGKSGPHQSSMDIARERLRALVHPPKG